MKIIRRAQTSANARRYNNSSNILITTDRIFIKIFTRDTSKAKKVLLIFRKSSVEHIPLPNTSNGTPDQMKTADHIFMKTYKEVSITIWKSSVERRPWQAPALLAPAQITFLVLILEMWLSMTTDFINIAANAARRRYLCSTEGLRSQSASSLSLTLPLRYWIISDSRKMYNLLTLVDRLDFICKRKRKSILVAKNEKKRKKKSLLWLRASYLYRKIVLSDPVEGRSITRHWLRLRSLGGRSPQWDDDAYLSFINRGFVYLSIYLGRFPQFGG